MTHVLTGNKKQTFSACLALLFLILAFLYRPALLAGNCENALILIPEGAYAFLACGLTFLCFQQLRNIFSSFSKLELFAWAVLFCSGVIHFAVNGFYLPEYLGLGLLWFAIPCFGVCFREELVAYLPRFFIVLWFWNLALNCINEARGSFLNGIAGNWNWSAVILVVTTPFVFLPLYRYFRSRLLGKEFSFLLSLCVIGPVTGYFLFRSGSRGAALALAAGLVLLFFRTVNVKWRKILVFLGIIAVIAGTSVFLIFSFSEHAPKDEVRFALARSACRVIAAHPFGVGPETLEQYLSLARDRKYFECRNAAFRTVHPHNELLYIAASLGLPALAAWLFLTIGGILRFLFPDKHEKNSGKMNLLFFAWVVLLAHAMLDLTLFVWPTFLIGGLSCGIFWSYGKRRKGEKAEKGKLSACLCGSLFLLMAFLDSFIAFSGTYAMERAKQFAFSNPARAGECLKRAALIAPFRKEELFSSCTEMLRKNDRMSDVLAALDVYKLSPVPDYGNIHACRANALARLGKDEEAVAEYRKDLALFPQLILTRVGMMTALVRLKREEEADRMKLEIIRVMKARGIKEEHFDHLLRNPLADLQPYRLEEASAGKRQ